MYISNIIKFIIDVCMIFMPTLSFTQFFYADDQVLTAFNLGTCYVYIMCNIFRIGFYFGQRYEIAILIQSFFLIALMISIILYCSRVKRLNLKKLFITFVLFASGVFLFSYITRNVNFIVQSIGLMSTIVEVALAFPQIIQNYHVKSGEGIPLSTLGLWMFGDGFKTTYYLCIGAPIQFVLIGVIQLTCDFILAFQIQIYTPQIYQNHLVEPLKNFLQKLEKGFEEENGDLIEDLEKIIKPEDGDGLSIVAE